MQLHIDARGGGEGVSREAVIHRSREGAQKQTTISDHERSRHRRRRLRPAAPCRQPRLWRACAKGATLAPVPKRRPPLPPPRLGQCQLRAGCLDTVGGSKDNPLRPRRLSKPALGAGAIDGLQRLRQRVGSLVRDGLFKGPRHHGCSPGRSRIGLRSTTAADASLAAAGIGAAAATVAVACVEGFRA